jgi:ribosomal protein S18 acetylase RimI-like enzyme
MTHDFAIRACTPADAALLAALGAELFVQGYGATHPEPELSRYLARSFGAERFARELADPAVWVVVAEVAPNDPIGYAYLRETNGERPDGVDGARPFEVLRFYVDQAWHGRGVAQALMAACEAEARTRGGDVLWLSVWQEAARPLAFYRRYGFEVVGHTIFEFGERLDDDYVVAKRL